MKTPGSLSGPALPFPDVLPKDRTRFWAAFAAFIFVPAAVLVGVLTLTSERASRCLTYGEQCATGLPEWMFGWSLGVGAVALVVALAASAVRVRQVALATQALAECAALLAILGHV
ncbi:hypothetical protein [Streptomyces sp. NPDC054863]